MATMLARITVKPNCERAFEAIARDLVVETQANEPEMIRYEYWRGAAERTYVTMGVFSSFDAFIVHQASDHHYGATPALHEVIESISIEWLDPVDGANPAPRLTPATKTTSDNPIEQSYLDRYAAPVQDWWGPLRSVDA